jgi:hypothetical protein
MKNIITCAGLAAFGVASMSAAYAPGMTSSTETTKPWSVAASLRGFYDDNYNTAHGDLAPGGVRLKRDSFGIEVSPSASLNLFRDQTAFGLSYRYGMRFYEDRPNHRADHSHEANAKISHAFSPQYKVDASDSFVAAQEPEVLRTAGGVFTIPTRVDGSNIRNDAKVGFSAALSERFEATVGYNNVYWDFHDHGHVGSVSSLLDRVEHLVTTTGRFTIVPSTIGVIGYQYGMIDYTSPDALYPGGPAGTTRDNESHYVFLGVDHTFNPQLNASIRGGVQYTEYTAITPKQDTVSPYAEAGISYTYTQNSYVSLNIRHSRAATAVLAPPLAGATGVSAVPTLDAESTLAQISVNHQLTGKLNVTGIVGFQYSEFYGGSLNDFSENYLFGGVTLTYDINKFLAAETGYNYDRLDSDQAFRSFTRNRIFVGIRASY